MYSSNDLQFSSSASAERYKELQRKYANTYSSGNVRGSAHSSSSSWVSDTINWSAGQKGDGKHRSSPTGLGVSPYSNYSSGSSTGLGSSTSTWSKTGSSPSSAFGNHTRRPGRQPPAPPPAGSGGFAGSSSYGSAPAGMSSNASTGYRDLSGFTTAVPPSTTSFSSGPKSVSSNGSGSSVRSGRSTRSRKSAEYQQNRKELDELMNKILELQDQGRFSEVTPYMKRIEQLQRKIESRFEEDHVAITGKAPDIPSPVAAAPSPSPKQEDKHVEFASLPDKATMMAVSVPAQDSTNQQADDNTSSSDDDDDDEDEDVDDDDTEGDTTDSGASGVQQQQQQQQQQQRSAGGSAPTIPRRGRKFSLSRQVSDVLLLVGGDEEEEIITTLRNQQSAGSQETTDSGDSKSKSVFSSKSKASAKARRDAAKKDRHMLTMQGIIYKSPPDYKRFARWHYRYFMLAGPLLSYRGFKKKRKSWFTNSSSASGKNKKKKKDEDNIASISSTSRIIDLKGAIAELVTLDKNKAAKGRYEIRLQCANSNRVYRLRFHSKRLAFEWFVAIKNNIIVAAKEGDLANFEKKRRAKKRHESDRKDGWRPETEPSRVGEDLTATDWDNEDIHSFYKVLGVTPSASHKMIKTKYRELARTYHPDKNIGIDTAHFALIARAFDTLESPDSRKQYDLCERVKKLFREGIICQMHEEDQTVSKVVMIMDHDFKHLYWQDSEFGSVLHEGYKYVQIRFIQEIMAGSDGFDCPPGKGDCCLSLIGVRLGCTIGINRLCKINLQFKSKEARDEILDGFRILRCNASELFKQRLEEIKAEGLR